MWITGDQRQKIDAFDEFKVGDENRMKVIKNEKSKVRYFCRIFELIVQMRL